MLRQSGDKYVRVRVRSCEHLLMMIDHKFLGWCYPKNRKYITHSMIFSLLALWEWEHGHVDIAIMFLCNVHIWVLGYMRRKGLIAKLHQGGVQGDKGGRAPRLG